MAMTRPAVRTPDQPSHSTPARRRVCARDGENPSAGINELQVEDGIAELGPRSARSDRAGSSRTVPEHALGSSYARTPDLSPRYENLLDPLSLFRAALGSGADRAESARRGASSSC